MHNTLEELNLLSTLLVEGKIQTKEHYNLLSENMIKIRNQMQKQEDFYLERYGVSAWLNDIKIYLNKEENTISLTFFPAEGGPITKIIDLNKFLMLA